MIVASAASGVARPACRAEVAKLAASADDERGRRGTGTRAGSCLVRGGMKLLVSLVRVRAVIISARRVRGRAQLRASVTARDLAATLGELDPSQSRGATWMRDVGGLIWSGRNGPGLSRGEYCLQWHISKHISNRSGGDPLVVTPWPTNHDRDRETSLELVNPKTGPQLRASFCVNPTWTNDQHYAMRLTPGRREGVM